MHPYMPSTSTCSTSLKIYANLAADYQCCMSSTKSVIQCWTWPNPNLNDAASRCFSAIQKYEGGSITSQPINVVRTWGYENIRPYSCMYRSTDCRIDCTGKHVYEVNPFGPPWKRQKGHSFIRHRVTRAWFSQPSMYVCVVYTYNQWKLRGFVVKGHAKKKVYTYNQCFAA